MLLADVPGNISIGKKETKLSKDSVILLSQMGVIDKQRLIEKITKINKDIISKIENNIIFILGIRLV
jgi:mRNA interferase MazF